MRGEWIVKASIRQVRRLPAVVTCYREVLVADLSSRNRRLSLPHPIALLAGALVDAGISENPSR